MIRDVWARASAHTASATAAYHRVEGRELAAAARISVESMDALVAAARSLQILAAGADRETVEAVSPRGQGLPRRCG